MRFFAFLCIPSLALLACGARSDLLVPDYDASLAPDAAPPPLHLSAPPSRVVAAGFGHSCAVRAGRVLCWGQNQAGQLGDSTRTDRHTPTEVPGLDAVREVSLGSGYSCALRTDGSVWCWGQYGLRASSNTPVNVGLATDAVRLTAGELQQCAVRAGGTVVCSGLVPFGAPPGGACPSMLERQSVAIAGLERVVDVTVGSQFSCALRDDGTVWCWGCNTLGQLGDSTLTSHTAAATQVPGLERVVALDSVAGLTCAARDDGAARCWGADTAGAFLPGDDRNFASPTTVPLPAAAVGVAAAELSVCYRLADRGVACTGPMAVTMLGTLCGGNGSATTARVAGLQDIEQLTGRGWHYCALRADGAVLCWGCNAFGQVGDGTTNLAAAPEPVLMLR